MAKDRFSKFKKSNHSYRPMNHVGVGKRDKLDEKQRRWVINLIQNDNTTDWEKKFLRSILVEGKVPTEKQKVVIRNTVNKNRK